MNASYAIFDQFCDGVQVVDHQFRYLYLNPVVLEQSASTREQLLGRTMMECFPGIEHTPMFQALAGCMTKRESVRTTNDFTLPDKTHKYFQLRIEPVPDGVLIFSVDVSQEQAHLVLMERMEAELETIVERRTEALAAKNRELQDLTRIASEELRAPLGSLCAQLDLLTERAGPALDEQSARCLEQARGVTSRLTMVVESVLEHAALGENLTAEETDLDELVGQVCTEIEPSIRESGAQIETSDLPIMSVFPAETRLLFRHLIDNAIKFRRAGVPPRVHMRASAHVGSVQFEVADNGAGIEPDQHDRIFGLLRRGHSDAAGDGIGLSLCAKVVALHGGKIWVESEPGKGSRFRFTLRPAVTPFLPAHPSPATRP